MFRMKSNSIKTGNLAAQEITGPSPVEPTDVLEDAELDSAHIKPQDPTVPRTSTLKRISKQLSKVPFRRRALTKDSDSEKNEPILPTDSENRKRTSSKSIQNEGAILEGNGTQENPIGVSLPGDDAFGEEVRLYLKSVLFTQNEKIAHLENQLTRKESALIEANNLHDSAIAQISLLKDKLGKEYDLKMKNDSLQQQIYSLENEKSQLQTKFDQTVYKLLNSVSEKSAESMLEIAASINQIKESQLIIEGKVTHVRKTSSQIQSERQANLSSIDDKLLTPAIIPLEKDRRLEEAQNACLELRKDVDLLQKKSREIEITSQSLTAENLREQKRIAELESAINSEIVIKKSLEIQVKNLEQNAEDLTQQLGSSRGEIKEVKLVNGKHLAEIASFNKEIVKFIGIIQDKNSFIDMLEKQMESFASPKNQTEKENLKQKALSTASETEILKIESQNSKIELSKLKNIQAAAENENSNMKTEILVLKNYQLELEAEKENLKIEISQLKNKQALHIDEVECIKKKLETDILHLTEQLHITKNNAVIKGTISDGSNDNYDKITKCLIREKSIIEYAFGTFKAQTNLKEKESEQAHKNLTKLFLSSETQLSNAKAKIHNLLVLNEELEQKVCKGESHHKEPDENLTRLLAAVESRLNSAMIDLIICQENLESTTADRDQKNCLLEEWKKKNTANEEANIRLNADFQALKEELFCCKLNYKDEIEKLSSQIVELGGSVLVNNFTAIASMNSKEIFMMNEQHLSLVDEDILKIPTDINENNLIVIGENIIEIVKCLTSRASIVDVNQKLLKLWKYLIGLQSRILEDRKIYLEKSSICSHISEDYPQRMVPQNSVVLSIADKSEESFMLGVPTISVVLLETGICSNISEDYPQRMVPQNSVVLSIAEKPEESFMLGAPTNSVILLDTDHWANEIKKKDQDINYLEEEMAKLMDLMDIRDTAIKDLNIVLEAFKIKQETSEIVHSLEAQLHEKGHALKSLESEKNNLADQNCLMISNSAVDSREPLEFAQKNGELELQHGLQTQNLKDQIKDLKVQLENCSQKSTCETTAKSTTESKLEKLLMASKIELLNFKKEAKVNEKEILTLHNEIAAFKSRSSSELPLFNPADFSWNITSMYLDFQHIIFNKPIREILKVEKKHLHYFHLCYTMTLVAMFSM